MTEKQNPKPGAGRKKYLKAFAAVAVISLLVSVAVLYLGAQSHNHGPNPNPYPWSSRPGAPEGCLTVMYEVEVSPWLDENLTHAHVIVPLPVVDNKVLEPVKVENEAVGSFTYSWRYVNEPYQPYPGVEIFVDGLNYDLGYLGDYGHLLVDFFFHVPVENIPRITVPVQPEPGTTVVYAEWTGGPKGWFKIGLWLHGPVTDATHSYEEIHAENVPYNNWYISDRLEGRVPGWYLIGLENVLFAPYLGPTFPENLHLS
jgi:hypothetical protein